MVRIARGKGPLPNTALHTAAPPSAFFVQVAWAACELGHSSRYAQENAGTAAFSRPHRLARGRAGVTLLLTLCRAAQARVSPWTWLQPKPEHPVHM